MASKSRKWLMGCGIGCALVVVLVVSLVAGAALFLRGKFHAIQEASDSRRQLVQTCGPMDSYVPPQDGAVSPERMEAFLAVRESLRTEQARLEAALNGFDVERLRTRRQSFMAVLGILNDLSNVITPVGEYVDRRNRALLDRKMGFGEYTYIYSLAYHSWLGHAPEEGPPLLTRLGDGDREALSRGNSIFAPENVRLQYRRLMLRLLRNQLDSLKTAEETDWRRTLTDEIERIDRHLDRIAWQDNIPPRIEACLRPYRSRLEGAYCASTNFLELLTTGESGQFELNF